MTNDRVARDWRAQQPEECQMCGFPRTRHVWPNKLDIHEIVCGTATRQLCRETPAGMLLLCRFCHDTMHGLGKREAVVLGLAIKSVRDPEYMDVEAVCRIWKPKCTELFIDDIEREVTAAIERMGR